MSAYRPTQDDVGDGPGAGKAGAIPKLFFAADRALDDIAAAAPTIANEIDDMKNELKDLLGRFASNGASEKVAPTSPAEEGMPNFRM